MTLPCALFLALFLSASSARADDPPAPPANPEQSGSQEDPPRRPDPEELTRRVSSIMDDLRSMADARHGDAFKRSFPVDGLRRDPELAAGLLRRVLDGPQWQELLRDPGRLSPEEQHDLIVRALNGDSLDPAQYGGAPAAAPQGAGPAGPGGPGAAPEHAPPVPGAAPAA
ncbi:MAG: hypothetical protein HY928_07950, partial [Elusimicrobia bacterium]|nr:hypothetical protein [Elusimicrobiota bacterium]